MNYFSIDLTTNIFELNFFTGESDVDCSLTHARQIRFKGEPSYDVIGADYCHLKENDKVLDMPHLVSVYIRDNTDQESQRNCRYFPNIIDDDGNEIISSSFEICVDYDQTEFEIIWDMFSKPEKCTFKFKASVKAPEVESPGMGVHIQVAEDREWQLSYYSLDKIVNP